MFPKNRVTAVAAGPEQLGPKAQRLVGGMAHAEHPLVAAHRAHAPTHLIGEGLESESMIRRGEGAGKSVARALARLGSQEVVDGFLEAAPEQVLIALERDEAGGVGSGVVRVPEFLGKVKAVDGIEEEQRAHSFVKIAAAATELV